MTKPWGVPASEAIAAPLPEKWDYETTKMRLEDHCRALAQEGHSREDALEYLKIYNDEGAAEPAWFRDRLVELIKYNEAQFAEWEREEKLEKKCTPMTEEELTEHAVVYPILGKGEGSEGLFPRGEVSLIGGSSGSGKTTWMVPVLETVRLGLPVLGRETHPMEFRILMHDRSFGAFVRTSRRMRLSEETRDCIYRLNRSEQKRSAPEFLQSYINREEQEGVGIVFIEGLDMWVPAGKVSDFQVVCDFLDDLQRVAERNHISLIGSVGNPKMKRGEHYELHRDRLFGSVAWGRKSETIVGIQATDKDVSCTIRELTVLPRNGGNEVFYLDFKAGRMVHIDKPAHLVEAVKEIPLTKRVNALAAIRQLPNGTKLTPVMLGLSSATYAQTMGAAMREHIVRQERNRYIVTGGKV